MAYLFNQAGGVEYGHKNESILEIKPNNIHQRVPVKLGDQSFKS